jgi:hypothetical protein
MSVRSTAILTVLLCAAVEPGPCDTPTYSAQPTAVRYGAEPTAEPARPASSRPQIVLKELPEGEAWRAVKSTLGSDALVLQPTVVPARFTGAPVMIEYAYWNGADPRYRVGYRGVGGLINIAAGAVNSGPPTATETIVVRGIEAAYSTSESWPERQVQWSEGGVRYSVQARGVSKAELLEVVYGLVPVP